MSDQKRDRPAGEWVRPTADSLLPPGRQAPEMPELTTYAYADVSTGHIHLKDSGLLEGASRREDPEPLIVYGYPEGYFVYCHEIEQTTNWAEVQEAGFSRELCDILAAASKQGCVLVRFDRDGMEYPDLPLFDWDEEAKR